MKARLTYSNVTATLALVFAMAGGAYAATALPRNSVGTPQLKKNAVTSAKVKDRSLRTRDINAADVATLRGAKGDTGAAGTPGAPGTPGAKGDTGLTGARGPSNVFVARNEAGAQVGTGETELLSLALPAGRFALIGKAVGNNGDVAGAEARITCRLNGPGGQIDESVEGAEDNTRFDDLATVALVDTLELASPGNVTIGCLRGGSTNVLVSDVKLVAIQTESITTP